MFAVVVGLFLAMGTSASAATQYYVSGYKVSPPGGITQADVVLAAASIDCGRPDEGDRFVDTTARFYRLQSASGFGLSTGCDPETHQIACYGYYGNGVTLESIPTTCASGVVVTVRFDSTQGQYRIVGQGASGSYGFTVSTPPQQVLVGGAWSSAAPLPVFRAKVTAQINGGPLAAAGPARIRASAPADQQIRVGALTPTSRTFSLSH